MMDGSEFGSGWPGRVFLNRSIAGRDRKPAETFRSVRYCPGLRWSTHRGSFACSCRSRRRSCFASSFLIRGRIRLKSMGYGAANLRIDGPSGIYLRCIMYCLLNDPFAVVVKGRWLLGI